MTDNFDVADMPVLDYEDVQDKPIMDLQMVKCSDLVLDARNARRGDVASIVESLKEFGQHRPLVVRREDNTVIVGNHTLKAARTLGWEKIGVVYVDDDREKAIRRGLADNATGDRATWDDQFLAELLMEVGTVPGFNDKDVDKIIADFNKQQEEEQEAPTYPLVPRLNEEYDYVIIVATNATDVAYIKTKFDLQKSRSYKSKNVGVSHVISVERLQELWGS